MDESEQLVARNEAVFRKVNEGMHAGREGWLSLVCECGRLGCARLVEVTRAEYEGVRAHARRFIVLPGHELPDTEEVVERVGDRFFVVEKHARVADIAEATDPRAEPER
jgi:hypothetical protein